MADLTVPKGDKGFYFLFTVKNSVGAAYNLTGYTIKLKVWVPGTTGALIVDGSCSIVSAADGTCRYLVAANNFSAIGFYYAKLELTKTDVIESTETFTIEVKESG